MHIWIGIIHKAKLEFNNNLEDLGNGVRLLPKYILIGNSWICDINPGSHRDSKRLLGGRSTEDKKRITISVGWSGRHEISMIQNDEAFKMQIISEMISLIFSNPFGLWDREMREEKKIKKREH